MKVECVIKCEGRPVAMVDTSTHDIEISKDAREAVPKVRVHPAGEGHTWVRIEDVGELEQGIYRVADADVDGELVCADAEFIELAGELQWFWLDGEGADPTHVLSPHLGPIPECDE